jgi:hypothetical protein
MLEREFGRWLTEQLSSGAYRAWLVHEGAAVAGGGGATVVPWAEPIGCRTDAVERKIGQISFRALRPWNRDVGRPGEVVGFAVRANSASAANARDVPAAARAGDPKLPVGV